MTPREQRRDAPPRLAALAGVLSLIGVAALSAAAAVGLRFAHEPHEPERGGYEQRDAPPKLVVATLAGLLSLVAIGVLVGWAILAGYGSGNPAPSPTGFDQAAAVPASPRLEVDQTRDRIALERQADAHLTGYSWSNQAAGLARIPIERAMALQAAEGWPDTDTNTALAPNSNVAESLPPDAAPGAASNSAPSQP